jgi:hypothetical protein
LFSLSFSLLGIIAPKRAKFREECMESIVKQQANITVPHSKYKHQWTSTLFADLDR